MGIKEGYIPIMPIFQVLFHFEENKDKLLIEERKQVAYQEWKQA